jgi:hypothetical protein
VGGAVVVAAGAVPWANAGATSASAASAAVHRTTAFLISLHLLSEAILEGVGLARPLRFFSANLPGEDESSMKAR